MNPFPSFNSDKFPKDGDYKDFYRAVQGFQQQIKNIGSYGQLEVEAKGQKGIQEPCASASAVPIEDEEDRQTHLITPEEYEVKVLKWRASISQNFQNDSMWNKICRKAEEKFKSSDPKQFSEWQTRRDTWKQHAIFAHYTSDGLVKAYICIKHIQKLYKDVKHALVKLKLNQEFITEYQQYLEQVKIWKGNTKQALIYSMLARLEQGAKKEDITYDDLLFPLYTEVNQLLEVQEQKEFSLDAPLKTMTPELFQKFHLAIVKYQRKAERASIAKRVNTLPWFHEKSVPFKIETIIHSEQLFVLPNVKVNKYSNQYKGPNICDLALYSIYWSRLQKLVPIDSLNDHQQMQDVYKIIDQLVSFYIKQFDATQKTVLDDAKKLQGVWKDALQKNSDTIFSAIAGLTDYFFKIAEKNSKESLTLCPIFHRLNELADNTLSIGNAAVEYKKKRAHVQGVVGVQFMQEVLKKKIKPSVFFELFSALIPPQLKEPVDILHRVIRDSESEIEASTLPILEQVKDALNKVWSNNVHSILMLLVEYLVQTVTDPKSSLLSIIKQYDASIQSSNKKTPLYIVRWLSGQNERIKEVQEKLLQTFPLEKRNIDAFSAEEFDRADAIVSSIERLKAYAEFDRNLLDQLKSHLRKYIEQKAVSEYSNVLFKALTLLQDQTLFYEFGKKHFEFCTPSLKVILRDAFFFELLHLCPQLLQEVRNVIFKCMDSHIEDVIQNIANFADFSFLSGKQKEHVLLAIDKYWLRQLQEYSAIDEDVLRVKLNKAESVSSTLTLPQFPLTERYKKEIVHWLDDKLVQHTYKFDSALKVVLMRFGTVEQKQKFYTVCFECVFGESKFDERASQILLRIQVLGYRVFLEKYGRENVSKVFAYVKNFFKNPVFDETRYTILKNNFSITEESQEQESENIVHDENYRTYCYLCKEFEKVFNEQYSAIISTVDLLEAGLYKEAYTSAQVLDSKIPASGRILLTEADHHAKEAMKLLFKKIKEWLLEQITNTKKYSIDDIKLLVELFKKEFLTPCIAKQNGELYEWSESLSTLCAKASDIFNFYRNIQDLVHSALNTSWIVPFNRKDLSEIFELLPISAKKFLLDQLIKTPLIGQSTHAREAWVLLIAVIKEQSTNGKRDLERIQELAASEKSSIQSNSNNIEKDHALLSERIWHTQLLQLFPQAHNSDKNAVQLLRIGSRQALKEVWDQLFDATGTPLMGKAGNRHIVLPVTTKDKDVFYFKFFPDAPGIQWMSCALRTLLWGEKQQKTFKIELAKFPAGTGDTSIAYPVLISQEIPGKTLAELWQENRDIRLNGHSFSREILRILIDLEQDGKPENYIAVAMDDGTYQLVNVDGEQAFAPTAVLRSVSATGTVTTQLLTKSILFCCPNMKENISNEIMDEFLKINPIEFLQTFIRDVYRYNTLLLQLFSHKECMLWWNQKEQRFLVAPLREDLVQSMYTTLCRIQEAFQQAKSEGGITHIELLRKVHPLLSSYYDSVLDEAIDPNKRFLKVVADEYKVIHNPEKDHDHFLTSQSSRQVVQSMFGFIPNAQEAFASYVIGADRTLRYLESLANQRALSRQAQQELIDGTNETWKKITLPLYKEQVLNGIPGIFPRIMWQKLSEDKQKFILQSILDEVQAKKLSLQALKFSHCSVLSNDMLKKIIEMSPELKFLDISYCSQLDEAIVRDLSFYCPTLRNLKMEGLGINTLSNGWWNLFSLIEFSELRYLSCNECAQLDRIVLNAPQLRVISLKNCKKLTELSLKCPNFARAFLDGCNFLPNRLIGEKDITIFNTTKALQNTIKIDFHDIRRGQAHLQQIKEKLECLKGVTELIIKNPCSDQDDVKKPGTLRREGEFVLWLLKMYGPGLTSLNISGCLWVDDSKFKEIVTACPKLERFFCAYTRITDESKDAFYLSNLQLKEIDISDTYSGDMVISAIVMKCPNLEYIKLSRTSVTDRGLQILNQYGLCLKKLDVSGCSKISDRGIASLLENMGLEHILDVDSQITDRLVLTVFKFRKFLSFVKFCNAPDTKDKAFYLSEIGYTIAAIVREVPKEFLKEHFRYIKVLDLSYCTNIETIVNGNGLIERQDSDLLSIVQNCSSLEQLNIEAIDICDEVIEEMALYLGSLKKITLSLCKKVTDRGLIALIQKCPNLEELDLRYSQVSCEIFEKISHQVSLKKIALSYCAKVTDRGLIALVQKCPQLSMEDIDLADCERVTDQGLIALVQKCPNLEGLNLRNTGVNCEGFEKLVHELHALKRINLFGCKKITDQGLVALVQKCPQLSMEDIDLADCEKITDRGLIALVRKCPNLESLNLRNTGVSCEGFGEVAHSLNALKKINLSLCKKVADLGLIALVQKCPHIQEIDLQGTAISCKAFEKFAHKLNNLKTMNLYDCREVTDRGLIALIKKCPSLEDLNLSYTKVSFEGFEYIDYNYFRALKSINLSYCREVTDLGLIALVEKSPKLSMKDIALLHCVKVTDLGLMALIKKCPDLESLNLGYTKVSCEEFEELAYELSLLKRVSLSSCKKVTDRGLIALVQKCPNLESLDFSYIGISCEIFEELVHQLSTLKSINLSYCGVTDLGLIALIQKCPNLESLNLRYTGIKCEIFEKLAHQLSALRSIDLSYCEVTDKDLVALLQKCSNLESLDLSKTEVSFEEFEKFVPQLSVLKKVSLSDCKKVTDRGLIALVQKCPNLEDLDLSYTKFSCEIFEKFGHQLSALKSVDLSYCEVTDKGLIALIQRCPNIKAIDLRGTFISSDIITTFREKNVTITY